MAQSAYTGNCDNCKHAQTTHNSYGTKTCKAKKCFCPGFAPEIDIEKYNTADGLPPVQLYQFQEDYLRGMPSKYIMAADTGTGKSFMSIAHYDRKAYPKPLVILAPASKVSTGDWERDVAAYFAGRLQPEVIVYSYEKFSRINSVAKFKETGIKSIADEFLKKHPVGDFALIADEVHKAKNPQSKMGKAVFEVATKADFFVGLSATPLPNGWQDAINYFKIFGFVKNKTEFFKKFVDQVTYKGFPEIRGYYHVATLQSWWNQIAKPLSKDKALDLPAMTMVPVTLPAGSDYIKVERERLFGDKFLDNPSALLHALRQSNTPPKIKWLDEFLEGTGDNVVIFYNYKSERDEILAMLKKNHKGRKVFRIDGEEHEAPGKSEWSNLQRTITVAQYQSGSTGIELTYASTTIYFSPTYSYSSYEQSIGRTNRNGQIHKMTFFLLCAPATIEKDVWAALRNKSDFQAKQWYEKRLEEGK